VKEAAEVKLGCKFKMYKAYEYQTKIETGTLYRIMVRGLIYAYVHIVM